MGCGAEIRASYELNIYVLADVGQERGKEKKRDEEERGVENRRQESKVRGEGGLWERENRKVCGQLIIGL